MAPKVTSSSTRSKRRGKKPVTTTKGRQNRQSASTAQVTQGGTRGSGQPRVTNAAQRTRSRSSPVTGSGTNPSRPALPPAGQTAAPRPTGPVRPSIGNVSGPASSPSRSRSRPTPPKPTNPARPSIGNVSGPASSPSRPAASNPTGPVRPSIGNVSGPASSPSRPPAPRPSTGAGANAAVRTGVRGLSRVPGPIGRGAAALLGILDIADAVRGLGDPNNTYNRATQRLRERYAPKPRNRPSGDAVRNGSFIGGGDTRTDSAASRRSGGRGVSPGSVRGKGTPAAPARPPAAPARPSRTSGGTNPPSSGSSRPAGAQSSPSARPSSSASSRPSSSAQTPQATASAAKAKSGSYGKDGKQPYNADKKNNPLMARTFGYQTGEGPGQKKDRGPVQGTGPVKNGDSYAKKLDNKGNKRGAGRAASAGAKSEPVTKQAGKEQSILDEIKRKKREQQK